MCTSCQKHQNPNAPLSARGSRAVVFEGAELKLCIIIAIAVLLQYMI